jgi:energy-coupling factor transporter transmembrane protein EcfT
MEKIEIGGFTKLRSNGLMMAILGGLLIFLGTGPGHVLQNRDIFFIVITIFGLVFILLGMYYLVRKNDHLRVNKKNSVSIPDNEKSKSTVLAECRLSYGGKIELLDNYLNINGKYLVLRKIDSFKLVKGSIVKGIIIILVSSLILFASIVLYFQTDSEVFEGFMSVFDDGMLILPIAIAALLQFGFFGLRQIIELITHPSQAHFKIITSDEYKVNLTKMNLKDDEEFMDIFNKQWQKVKNS